VTASQQLRLLGFNASLAQRGVVLELGELTFNALVEKVEPDRSEFSLSNETRDFSKVHILRSSPGVSEIEVGSALRDTASQVVHRVTCVENHPSSIALVFHCETAPE
jgi:hypothetical protein